MPKRYIPVLAACAVLACSAPAYAEQFCKEREELFAIAEQRYGETPRVIAYVNERTVLEVLVSPTSGTWTLIMSDVIGKSCVLLDGQAWTILPETQAGEPM